MFAKYRVYLIAIWVVVCGFLISNALISNPSAAEAVAKLSVMQGEMEILLREGGRVVKGTSNAKYGGALLIRYLSYEGRSDLLLQKYQKKLISREWWQIGTRPLMYCKEGILVTLEPNDGVGTNYVEMTYDALTIKRCGRRQK